MGTTNRNGQGYYLTDEEFIAKWKENPSPTLMAQASGFSVRAVQNRRRNIEIKHKIELVTTANLIKEFNLVVISLENFKNRIVLITKIKHHFNSVYRFLYFFRIISIA